MATLDANVVLPVGSDGEAVGLVEACLAAVGEGQHAFADGADVDAAEVQQLEPLEGLVILVDV